MPSQRDIVREWLSTLAALVGTQGSMAADSMRVYVPYLLGLVPIAAFSPESVRDIARDCRGNFMPSFGDLCAALEAWWAKHRPDKVARVAYVPKAERVEIPKPRDPPTEAEAAYVSGIVAALKLDLQAQMEARDKVSALRMPMVRPSRLSDQQLLAIYEQSGPSGVIPAQRLRHKLALELSVSLREIDAAVPKSVAYEPFPVRRYADPVVVTAAAARLVYANADGEIDDSDEIPE